MAHKVIRMEGRPVPAQSPNVDVHGAAESPLHEPSVIRLRAMIWFFVWFFIVGIVLHILLFVVYRVYLRQAKEQSTLITGLSGDMTRMIPPEPRLQPSVNHDALPRVDMDVLRARELADFRRRGWVDEKTNQVAIPQAIMQKVAQLSGANANARPATRSAQ
jgi:hypothetical protein